MRKSGRYMTSGARHNVKKRKEKHGGDLHQRGVAPRNHEPINVWR